MAFFDPEIVAKNRKSLLEKGGFFLEASSGFEPLYELLQSSA